MPTIGETAPDFELLNEEGKPVKLSGFRGKKVVLYFYPEDFTSGCEMQACTFREAYPQIEASNGVVLGISPDSVESHRKFRNALHLPSDPDFKVAAAWDCVKTNTGDGEATSTSVRRGHYVIDEQGKIVDAQTPVKAGESTKLALEKL